MDRLEILAQIYPAVDGPRIDIWKTSPSYHEFGYWSEGDKAGPGCPPEKSVKIYINKHTGDYMGGPKPKAFYEWLGACRKDPSKFTLQNYSKEFIGI